MGKPKTVKMRFSADQYYVTAKTKETDLKYPLYEAGKVYDVEESMVPRWLKRGGIIVAEEATDGRATEVEKADQKEEEIKPPVEEQVEDEKEKEEDVVKPEAAKTSSKPQGRGSKRS